MKARIITIGEYQMSSSSPFCLYQLPSPLVTPPRSLSQDQRQEHYFNYFCLEDLFNIYTLHAIHNDLAQCFQQFPGFFFKDSSGRSYIKTQLMADIALKHNLCALSDLCLLDGEEILSGSAAPLLKNTFVRLNSAPILTTIESFEPKPLSGREWFFKANDINRRNECHFPIKSEPFSPTLPLPKAAATVSVISPSNSPQRSLHLSSECSISSLNNENRSMDHLSPPPFTQFTESNKSSIRLPKPSQLLMKRLTPRSGYKKNLTISTPSYHKEPSSTTAYKSKAYYHIQTAPLRRSTYPPINNTLHQQQQHKIYKRSSKVIPTLKYRHDTDIPHLPASATARPIATSAAARMNEAEDHNTNNTITTYNNVVRFPSPPIVPSQQPAWNQYRQSRKQYSQQQQQQQHTKKRVPKNLTASSLLTSQQNLTAKQKFLQPFEYLYDQIEQTRHLKTTLDDQIRRSSTLLQTLQTSSTVMIEPLIHQKVSQHMLDSRFEQRLRECHDRISHLECRFNKLKDKDQDKDQDEDGIALDQNTTTAKEEEEVQKPLIMELLRRIEHLEDKYHRQQ
ncbi:hypothetical protein BDF20DRAFT_835449 [Mycotypha africana]|uniref:uncharacterized protein n=1 Tax=Mycotypha africana TaxID=64632 RepID=UPI002301E241|nr:uncharacterized protein BDF20DRAFT_835449 [Mycotypha africana]KAI8979424.1 hypothetical protein BDF20DRAFT_835449 [Mycotypha africana]